MADNKIRFLLLLIDMVLITVPMIAWLFDSVAPLVNIISDGLHSNTSDIISLCVSMVRADCMPNRCSVECGLAKSSPFTKGYIACITVLDKGVVA